MKISKSLEAINSTVKLFFVTTAALTTIGTTTLAMAQDQASTQSQTKQKRAEDVVRHRNQLLEETTKQKIESEADLIRALESTSELSLFNGKFKASDMTVSSMATAPDQKHIILSGTNRVISEATIIFNDQGITSFDITDITGKAISGVRMIDSNNDVVMRIEKEDCFLLVPASLPLFEKNSPLITVNDGNDITDKNTIAAVIDLTKRIQPEAHKTETLHYDKGNNTMFIYRGRTKGLTQQ